MHDLADIVTTEHVKSIICLKCSCSDSLTDVRGLSVVRYMVWVQIAYAISLEYQNNHCLLSLSSTRVTTRWLKQPIIFAVIYVYMHGVEATVLTHNRRVHTHTPPDAYLLN